MIRRVALFADSKVGFNITKFMIGEFKSDLVGVITVGDPNIISLCNENSIPCLHYDDESKIVDFLNLENVDLCVLAWWPKIISENLITVPKFGFINTHNSLLPHNRGKHPHFWAIIENLPYGVTLHQVDGGIDTGKIVAQRQIKYGWEDNSGTIYEKSLLEMISLFEDVYPALREDGIIGVEQGDYGSFHWGRELDDASRIDLDRMYSARELINIIRARTTDTDFPASFFKDCGDTYRIKVIIEKE